MDDAMDIDFTRAEPTLGDAWDIPGAHLALTPGPNPSGGFVVRTLQAGGRIVGYITPSFLADCECGFAIRIDQMERTVIEIECVHARRWRYDDEGWREVTEH